MELLTAPTMASAPAPAGEWLGCDASAFSLCLSTTMLPESVTATT